jgi:ABC-type Na+ efflux pump permease subunit
MELQRTSDGIAINIGLNSNGCQMKQRKTSNENKTDGYYADDNVTKRFASMSSTMMACKREEIYIFFYFVFFFIIILFFYFFSFFFFF